MQSALRMDAEARKKIDNNNYYFLVVVAGLKREKKKFGFRFSIPKIPEIPELHGRSYKKKKVFFSLVLLLTHPSSIPLLGGLTPKFSSLSLHSL
jgi:hypothetical protein